MRLWRKIRERWGEDGLAEEMRAHREMIEDRLRAEGLSPAEARTWAAREFSPLATAIEDRREEWTWAWVEALWSDAKYACRALARDKTFAATAVLTLGADEFAGIRGRIADFQRPGLRASQAGTYPIRRPNCRR